MRNLKPNRQSVSEIDLENLSTSCFVNGCGERCYWGGGCYWRLNMADWELVCILGVHSKVKSLLLLSLQAMNLHIFCFGNRCGNWCFWGWDTTEPCWILNKLLKTNIFSHLNPSNLLYFYLYSLGILLWQWCGNWCFWGWDTTEPCWILN